MLRPVYDRTEGLDGYASLEVAPDLAHDPEATLASALDLWRRLDRPNVMIKIPGTPAGVEAIRRATAAGVNVNVTLLFSVDAHAQVAEAYIAGLEERVARGEPIRDVVSVASFFVSRVDTASTGCSPSAGARISAGALASPTHLERVGRPSDTCGAERCRHRR